MTQHLHAELMGKMLPRETGAFVIWMGAGEDWLLDWHALEPAPPMSSSGLAT
jgi:hypothetical protein